MPYPEPGLQPRDGESQGDTPALPTPTPSPWRARQSLSYPRPYLYLITVSALDILSTWVILLSGGREVNFLADRVISTYGAWGIIVYKFALMVLVVVICEEVGRRNPSAGRRLAWFGVGLSSVPVVLGVVQIAHAIMG